MAIVSRCEASWVVMVALLTRIYNIYALKIIFRLKHVFSCPIKGCGQKQKHKICKALKVWRQCYFLQYSSKLRHLVMVRLAVKKMQGKILTSFIVRLSFHLQECVSRNGEHTK